MWRRKTPTVQTLIKRERQKLRKQIKRTRYPIFNLYRLMKRPCGEFGCSARHYDEGGEGPPPFIVFVVLVFTAMCLILFMSIDAMRRDQLALSILLLGVTALMPFSFLHVCGASSWLAHKADRQKKREDLCRENTPGNLLTKALELDIEQHQQRLLGEEQPLEVLCSALKERQEEAAQHPIVTKEVGYRECALVRVRVVGSLDQEEDVPTFYTRFEKFRREAAEVYADLLQQAKLLGERRRRVEQSREMYGFQEQEKTGDEVWVLENAIQQNVDSIYCRLQGLELAANELQLAATRVIGRHDVSEATKRKAAPELVESGLSEVNPQELACGKRN